MAHTTRITVSPDGRATIGADIVGALGARPGDELLVETTAGLANMRVAGKTGLDAFIGGLAAYAKSQPLTIEEIREITEAGWAGDR